MGAYDTIVLVIILAATFLGWRKGLATQVASIVSLAASFMVAVRFREPLSTQIHAEEPWNRFAAMLVLFLGTSLVIWIVFRQIRTSIEKMRLGDFDHQMGALFGAAKGVVLAGLVTMFAFTLLQEPQRRMIIESKSGVWIAMFMNKATAIMPDEIRQFVQPYLDNLDHGLGTPNWPGDSAWPGNVSSYPPGYNNGNYGNGNQPVGTQPPLAPWNVPQIPVGTSGIPSGGQGTDYEYRPAAGDNSWDRSARAPE